MNILVTGSTGLIGSALVSFLRAGGHQVVRLARAPLRTEEKVVLWDPEAGRLDPSELEGLEAVVHLAGESIAGRWTPEKKARIRNSRVRGTQLLAETLARLERPPAVLVSASAIGYYGDRGDEILREESPPGRGFLADVAQAWEAATEAAAQKGLRVVILRFGIVLSPRGGALAQMLLPFRLGLGGPIGSGQQYWSWIALDDVVRAIHHALLSETLRGPVNVVSPDPVRNREFARTLGRVLGRPAFLPMPEMAVRLLFGQMGEELLLSSQRVEPLRLLASGFVFQYPDVEGALRHLLRKS